MDGIVNPYTILGFFPDQGPSIEEVKSRYRFLAKIHHPDVGGAAEIFRVVNEAYTWVTTNENPGPSFFATLALKKAEEEGWRTNDKGNWIYRFSDGTNGTVFHKEGKWKWVYDNQWAKKWFSTAEEAITDFEDTWFE